MRSIRQARKYNLPMLITENGVEDPDDRLRPRYIIEHLHQVWRAVNFNWPVKGYFHWSLVDNFEWERGWTQRFGLWGLDVADPGAHPPAQRGPVRRDLQRECHLFRSGGEIRAGER